MRTEIVNCKQGSSEWFYHRLGIPTASNFKELLVVPPKKSNDAFSKGAYTYMYKLAGEILMREPQQNYSNEHMKRGHDNEDNARKAYSFQTGNTVEQAGVILLMDGHDSVAGYSPDGLVSDNGLIEIKDRLPHIQIQTIINDAAPTENIAQMQGGLWISECEWCDYVSYCPRLLKPFIKRVYRDEKMIRNIYKRVMIFNEELSALCEQLEEWSMQ